jgi:HAE1 family hydrophobic/amphiphilic exporter-1
MSLSEICIKRPVFATVLSLVIITLGIIFFTKLQIRGMPDIDPPIITVIANYEGANALYLEQQVTTRIEKAL